MIPVQHNLKLEIELSKGYNMYQAEDLGMYRIILCKENEVL